MSKIFPEPELMTQEEMDWVCKGKCPNCFGRLEDLEMEEDGVNAYCCKDCKRIYIKDIDQEKINASE